jgi:hypothetical protein
MVQSRFPNYETVILVDSDSLYKECLRKGLPSKLIISPEESWKDIKEAIGFSSEFRDNFWFKTVARFDAIRSYMETEPNCKVLHIEADVLLSPAFPMRFFETNEEIKLAYPITNLDQGVASTFFISNLASLEHFLKYCEECFEANPESTDVSILGSYYRDYPLTTWIMPSAPNIDIAFNEHATVQLKASMSENYSQVAGLFDASTWGQFFTGHDPKNSVGITPIFQNQNHHAIRTNSLKFRVTKEGSMYVIFPDSEVEIFSLHVHSKLEALFDSNKSLSELIRISSLQGKGTIKKINAKLFLRLLPSYLKYRTRLLARRLFKNV